MERKLVSFLGMGLLAGTIYAQTINVTPNWQLLGALDNINSSIFDGKCVDFVWKYDNGWQVHVANGKSYTLPSNVTTFNSINSAEGFWIKGNGNCQITTDSSANSSLSVSLSQNDIDMDANQTMEVNIYVNGADANASISLAEHPDFVTLNAQDHKLIISPTSSDEGYDGVARVVVNDGAASTDTFLHIHIRVPHIELSLETQMPSNETYDTLQVSSSPLDLTKTYYKVRYESHDGLEIERYKFNNGTIVAEELKNGSWIPDDNLSYTTSDNKEFILDNGRFEIKYLKTLDAQEGNTMIGDNVFQTGDVGYMFAFKQLKDNYDFYGEYEMKHLQDNQTAQYTSLADFINYNKVQNDRANWWVCNGNDCSNGGITFSADSNYTNGSGTLVEINNQGNVVNSNAGTWEIQNVNGEEILVPNITDPNYKDADIPVFKMDNQGLLRGEYEKAGEEGEFIWLNESAKDDFVNYIQGKYPSSN